MSINGSKAVDPRFWRRWYAAGAVTHQEYPEGLIVDNIITFPRDGYKALVLKRISDGVPAEKSTCAVIVSIGTKYGIGMTLSQIPRNSIPTEVFFRE